MKLRPALLALMMRRRGEGGLVKTVRRKDRSRSRWLVVLYSAALLASPACQSVKTRTFAADRAGAEGAIRVALSQDRPASIELTLIAEPADPPATRWVLASFIRGDEQASGVVALLSDPGLSLHERSRTFDATPEGLKAAAAFQKEAPRGSQVLLRYPNYRSDEPHSWRWFTRYPGNVIPFEAGVCSEYDCADYRDLRTVWVVVPFSDDRRFGPYAATPAGIAEAVGVAKARRGQVAIEMPSHGSGAREAHLSNVSVLEDGRICGEAYEYPLGVEERCYLYSRIAAFSVRDRNTNLADALGDAASFPFRLVGAAVTATVMGAAGN